MILMRGDRVRLSESGRKALAGKIHPGQMDRVGTVLTKKALNTAKVQWDEPADSPGQHWFLACDFLELVERSKKAEGRE